MRIRPAVGADVDEMAEIEVQAWQPVFDSFRQILGDELFAAVHPDWRNDKANQIRSAAATSEVQFLVAEEGNIIVGFVSWRVSKQEGKTVVAEIGNNAVGPHRQNQGIATSLYAEVLQRCRDEGVVAIKVTTGLDPSHAPARRAYEKAGFAHGVPMVTYWQDLR